MAVPVSPQLVDDPRRQPDALLLILHRGLQLLGLEELSRPVAEGAQRLVVLRTPALRVFALYS